jgi:hypothetical protein
MADRSLNCRGGQTSVHVSGRGTIVITRMRQTLVDNLPLVMLLLLLSFDVCVQAP